MKLELQILLKSDALIASGEGLGAIIDSDIIFDDLGLPYIPAKRIKGCLRDSISELNELIGNIEIDLVFGNNQKEITSSVRFSDLYIKDYENTYQTLKYYQNKFDDYISPSLTTSYFTEIRQQTRISEDGVAEDHSLRTARVIKKGIEFFGDIEIFSDNDSILKTLELACLNLRRIGTNRNRGFGEIKCLLLNDKKEQIRTSVITELEKLCK